MKKFLLFAAAALMVSTAGAQLKAPSVHSKAATARERMSQLPSPQKVDFNKISSVKEMKGADNSRPMSMLNNRPAPKKAGYLEPFYKRPAGMYCSPFISSDGAGLYSYGNRVFLMNKPFADYVWEGTVEGADENTTTAWDIWIRDQYYAIDYETEIAYYDYWSTDYAPIFYAYNGDVSDLNADEYSYQIKSYEVEENVGGGVTVKSETPAEILSSDTDETIALMFGDETVVDFMYSSKTMVLGGRNADQAGFLSRYYGADPYGDNEYGWWFGKNASHVDGIASAFEKPQHPYLLKNVQFQASTDMVVTAPVKLTCKVYRLDEIPEYQENGGVSLPLEPGELIVTGEATVTPTTAEDKNGLIVFTLYGQDEFDPTLTYEYHPTIDYPILVCVDGYNDPDKEDLVEFSAYISTDDQVDEGYGELTYLKQGIFEYEIDENGDTVYDEDGNPKRYFTGEYYWRGLNNYFSNGTLKMMTGISLFIGTENPFIAYVHGLEDGEYLFPDEGGMLTDNFEYSDGTYTTEGIEFISTYPAEDGDWWMTYNGSDELPDWLEINFIDDYTEEGEFSGYVTAEVTAQPLPEGVKYREATVRFEIAGDYKDFTFKQGEEEPGPDYPRGDVNGDHEVNIADVNCIIDIILGNKTAEEFEGRAFVNDDDEVNIADVNAIIDIIQKG
jgi:hypothetical protein